MDTSIHQYFNSPVFYVERILMFIDLLLSAAKQHASSAILAELNEIRCLIREL